MHPVEYVRSQWRLCKTSRMDWTAWKLTWPFYSLYLISTVENKINSIEITITTTNKIYKRSIWVYICISFACSCGTGCNNWVMLAVAGLMVRLSQETFFSFLFFSVNFIVAGAAYCLLFIVLNYGSPFIKFSF